MSANRSSDDHHPPPSRVRMFYRVLARFFLSTDESLMVVGEAHWGLHVIPNVRLIGTVYTGPPHGTLPSYPSSRLSRRNANPWITALESLDRVLFLNPPHPLRHLMAIQTSFVGYQNFKFQPSARARVANGSESASRTPSPVRTALQASPWAS